MKVTVCQLDPRSEHLDQALSALKSHVQAHASDFLLLPEMCFADWLAADRHVDENRWNHAVQEHARRIAGLGQLEAKAVLGRARL